MTMQVQLRRNVEIFCDAAYFMSKADFFSSDQENVIVKMTRHEGYILFRHS
jgi:hypothetical protein